MEYDKRLVSLQLAVEFCQHHDVDVIEVAQKFYEFFVTKETTKV